MVMIARAVIGLPGKAHAQVAEAYGRRVGLRMLMDMRCGRRAANVSGDNLSVVRYCASESRPRSHGSKNLEGPLCGERMGTKLDGGEEEGERSRG